MDICYIGQLAPDLVSKLGLVAYDVETFLFERIPREETKRLRDATVETIVGLILQRKWGAKFSPVNPIDSEGLLRFLDKWRPFLMDEISEALQPINLWQVTFQVEMIDDLSFIVYEEGVRRRCKTSI
ncbi:hypothetical protein [Vibrio phage vB_VmeM-Yong XC32]|nr:hypothetical protein [Vibrio phage vB_VmeM-Yong XC31]QAX96391.1 hypothetical protein [Vibrio phage vB_VmeM-Yong XC32]QAX96709.1 hypothetical protein [Vibrio phage vB_VmeM-Yong MS31]QAX97027.1 hypothetical protein [Vibrio phage vB_VmeM-Yong MS32]